MDASEYVTAVLEPMVDRYLAEPEAKELAFGACILAFHFVEYGKKSGLKPKADMEEALRNCGPEFEVVHAVANAVKHTSAENGKLKHLGLKEEDCVVAQAAAWSDGAYWAGGISWAGSPPAIQVKTPNGDFYDLSFILPRLLSQIKSLL